MSTLLEEHDYIGLSEVPSMENSEKLNVSSEDNERNTGLNMKATELRLGLPGSESPERDKIVYPLCTLKGLVSGAKRGFSDTIGGGSGKWVFALGGGSEADLAKSGGLFSPRGVNGGGESVGGAESGTPPSSVTSAAAKEVVPPSPKSVLEKKPQIFAARSGHGSAPAA
ncbi:hypothetical protein U1Q18_044524, partial [Sarracenia purpurea var. burkii]